MTGAIFPRHGGGEFSISALQLFSGCYLSTQMLFAYRMNIIKCLFLPETAQTLKHAYQITHTMPSLGSLIVFQNAFNHIRAAGVRSVSDAHVGDVQFIPRGQWKMIGLDQTTSCYTETAKPEAAAAPQQFWALILHIFEGENKGRCVQMAFELE